MKYVWTLFLLAAPLFGEWTVGDMLGVQGVAYSEASPDGKEVICEVQAVYGLPFQTRVERVEVETKRTTLVSATGRLPRWSPDGKWIAYVEGKGELHIVPAKGGKERIVPELPGGISTFSWAPDSQQIALLSAIPPQVEHGRVVDEDVPLDHIWLLDLKKLKVKQLTEGNFHCGTVHCDNTLAWAPEGKEVSFARMPSKHANRWAEMELAALDVSTGHTHTVARGALMPRYSPDGKWLAFVQFEQPARWTLASHVVLYDRETKRVQRLSHTPNEELMVKGSFVGWSGGSQSVLVENQKGLEREVMVLPVDGTSPRALSLGKGVVKGAALNPGGTVLTFGLEDLKTPQEVYVKPLDMGGATQVTALNLFSTEEIAQTKPIVWSSNDGLELEGLLTYPLEYKEGERVPLLTEIHGGPASVYQRTFFGNPDVYPLATFASEGYAVLRCNIRGSNGYGKMFRNANVADWGGKDFQDLMSGIDSVIEQGVADPERLGVMGWSFGGYMTAWAITQTGRFKAASVGAGLINLISFSGGGDVHGFLPDYFQGEIWEKFDLYLERSAIRHAANITTPTLIMHGEKDPRVPISQSYELYHALKRRDIPTQLIVYPDTPHAILDPNRLRDAAVRNRNWFENYVGGTMKSEKLPTIGFGTYPLHGKTCERAVAAAAGLGYHLIDTATAYANLEAVWKALRSVPREDVYIVSKAWHDTHTPAKLKADLFRTLKELQTDYLDAYLLHWPNSAVPIEETLHAMEELRQAGYIRHIGLSNVTIHHLKRALEVGVPITWVQNEMHPHFFEPELLELCKKEGISFQAWGPLGRGRHPDDPLLVKLGEKYGKTPAQISLKWIMQHGCVPLPGSRSEAHIEENLDIFDFTLSAAEMAQLDTQARSGTRERVTLDRGFGFTDEFDYSYEECWPKR